MFSITLKRAAATVGVLAGLLAAAAPASAQLPPTTSGYTPPIGTDKGSLAAAEQGVWGPIVYVGSSGGVKAATNAGNQTKDNAKAVVVLIGANDYGFAAESRAGRFDLDTGLTIWD
jgi:hypothetical protein